MWIGSYFGGGSHRPFPLTRFKKVYPHGELGFMGRRVREICGGRDGTLWIGTEDKGLFNYAPRSGVMTPFRHPLIYRNIHGLCPDGDELWVGTFSGDLWVATYAHGVFRYDVRKRGWRHYLHDWQDSASLPYNRVIGICEDSRKRLWLMTLGGGVCRYDPAGDCFVRYGADDGLPDGTVYEMVEDDEGCLWMTSNSGLVCFDPDEGVRHVYTTANGRLSGTGMQGSAHDVPGVGHSRVLGGSLHELAVLFYAPA